MVVWAIRKFRPYLDLDISPWKLFVPKKLRSQVLKENYNEIGLMGKRLIEEPWTMVAADIIGLLPLNKKGKNQYILVFVDLFTKWVEIIPIKKANGKTIES